jgi:hypothetical protein
MKLPFCAACGLTDELQHHHLVTRGEGGGDGEGNLITLCYGCHMKLHERQINGVYSASERISQAKADQKARGRYLGGKIPFGFRLGESGELVAHEGEREAIREMIALRAQGRPLRTIADAVRAKGYRISHEGVAGVLRASPARAP